MATKVFHHPECCPAHVPGSAVGCRLRIPPACKGSGAGTLTIEEYAAWDEEQSPRPTCVEG